MSPFEYVSVLISIILGLGITQILIGLSEVIRRWDRVTISWPLFTWIVLVFVMHVHEWWVIYSLKSTERWHLHSFLLVALYPINLFILANLLFPQNWPRKSFDMVKYFARNWTRLYGLALALPVITILQDLIIFRAGLQAPPIVLAILFIVLLFVRPRSTAFHLVFSLLLLGGLIADLIIERNMLELTD